MPWTSGPRTWYPSIQKDEGDMIKKMTALAVATLVAASLTLTACNMPAACDDDALTSSVITGKGGGSRPKVRLSKPRPGSKYKPHGSTSHGHSSHHDYGCDD